MHGDPFPVWGTCNGFELLTVLSLHDMSRLTHCQSENLANPLHLIPGWEVSRIYGPVIINAPLGQEIKLTFVKGYRNKSKKAVQNM